MAPYKQFYYETPKGVLQKRWLKPRDVAAPRKIDQQERRTDLAEKQTSEIFRVIFPINKCGSKQIILALDPSLDFQPVITVGKPGWSGVRLTLDAWLTLRGMADNISKFFNGELDASLYTNSIVQLGSTEKISFKHNWGKNLLQISEGQEHDSLINNVTIAKTTWDGLLNILPCINHELVNLEMWQPILLELFVTYVKKIKQCFPQDMFGSDSQLHQNDYEAIVKQITLDSLDFTQASDTNMDIQKAFNELQAFCRSEMANYLSLV